MFEDPAQPNAEPGWQLVPSKPTQKMIEQGEAAFRSANGACCMEPAEEAYEAMLAAAPPLAQSDADPVAWKPDANMRAELDRSEMVARAMLKEIMKQIDYIEAEGHIEWHKRIHVDGELYLPDISAAVLASLYTAPLRPDASAGLIEAEALIEALTPSAETKTAYMSEFSFTFGAYTPNVPWTTIKEIMAAIRTRAADRSGK